MLKNYVLKIKEDLGLVDKDMFYEMEDTEAYKPVIVKVNKD